MYAIRSYYECLTAALTRQQGEGPGHVDAVQPVRARAGQRRGTEGDKRPIGLQLLESPSYRRWIQIVDEATQHGLAFGLGHLEVVDDLVDQQLAFPIRITGMNDDIGLFEPALQHLELLLAAGTGYQQPLLRHSYNFV